MPISSGSADQRPLPFVGLDDETSSLSDEVVRLVHADSPASAKAAFYAGLFPARPDVYAVRWENARIGRAGWVPAVRGGWRKGIPAAEREYLPLTEEVFLHHGVAHRPIRGVACGDPAPLTRWPQRCPGR